MNDAPSAILLVDGDDPGRSAKARLLRDSGYAVVEARRGHEALKRVAAAAPDLVLLEVTLPDLSGIEACRRIKSAAPAVAVLQISTALRGRRERVRALEGGADAYLVEPIEPDELLASVHALLRMRKAEQELRRLNETLEARVAERTDQLADAHRRLEIEIADRRRAEEVLWHAQKLEAVGQLTGGVAHDFNNLLTVISGNLEMVDDALSGYREMPPPRMRRLVAAARSAAERGAQVTQQLLAFARRSVLRAETVDIAEIIGGFEGFLRHALGEAVAFEVSFDPELWRCRIDPVQLETSILNLVVNARDAMPGGGTLKITARNVESGEMKPEHAAELAPGAYLCISVADSGTGMPQEVKQHAFEPFFTTKEVGKGSGLGLSQVYGFAKQSGGNVVIDSTPGRGTVMSLYLPRSDAPVERHQTVAAAADAARGGQESILVVEDDDEVRELAVTMMRELGYHVLVSRDGLRALEVIRSDRPIDLLFSDVVMPGGISGAELAREAQSLRRGLKVLLTSGYPRTPEPHGGLPIIAKPWSRGELARRLRLALDGEDDRAR